MKNKNEGTNIYVTLNNTCCYDSQRNIKADKMNLKNRLGQQEMSDIQVHQGKTVVSVADVDLTTEVNFCCSTTSDIENSGPGEIKRSEKMSTYLRYIRHFGIGQLETQDVYRNWYNYLSVWSCSF